jgi:P27 family predicted phage terminase small subunit
MHEAGLLTPLDVDVLGAYCGALVQLERARQLLDAGLLVKGRGESLVTNPAWRIYRDASVLVRAYAAELGLTPSARSGIRVPSALLPPADAAD